MIILKLYITFIKLKKYLQRRADYILIYTIKKRIIPKIYLKVASTIHI